MPFITLQPFGAGSPTTVPVLADPVGGEFETFGDEQAAWDGTLLTRDRATKKSWTMRTPLLPIADAATLLTVLQGAKPHAAAGDLTGSLTVIVRVLRTTTQTLAGGARYRSIEFSVREE